MRALRPGSYSMAATRPGTPSLLRLKSMRRICRLWPPPRCRTEMRPSPPRPERCFFAWSRRFSGLFFVISEKVWPEALRRPGEVGRELAYRHL